MSNLNEFKDGDKVYCPILGTQVFELRQFLLNGNKYPLGIFEYSYLKKSFDNKGRSSSLGLPVIHHATEDNRLRLFEFYGVEFDKLEQETANE